jgi:predicted RND superfamily exporter protein
MNNLILFGALTGSAIVIALVANFLLAPALMHQLHKRRITA